MAKSNPISSESIETLNTMAVQLPHTIQTSVGMMLRQGRPAKGDIPSTVANLDRIWRISEDSYEAHEESARRLHAALDTASEYNVEDLWNYVAPDVVTTTAARYLQDYEFHKFSRISTQSLPFRSCVLRYAANLLACMREVTTDDLKRYIKTQTRFDLEQAAAVVVSAMVTARKLEDASRLVKELGRVLVTTSMWVDDDERLAVNNPDNGPFNSAKLAHQLKDSAAHKKQDIPLSSDYQELLHLLMRVRRHRTESRCLYIPKWMFKKAGVEAPEPFHAFFAGYDENLSRAPRPGEHPEAPREADSIVLSKKHFRSIQRRLFSLFRFWEPTTNYATRVRDLKNRVLYAGSWIEDRVLVTGDVALICHFFFYYQRRLQLKVVGDYSGGFLGKGDGSQIYQNNIKITSTFERVLQEIAESNEMGVIVTMGYEATVKLIDETCLLMKEYVDIYGEGKSENLVFKKGVRGGSGRGPVDKYNILCTVLSHLREQARDEGVRDLPGPTRKFLAKDIMYWNDGWADDAFAGDQEPGWNGWLRRRGLAEDEDWVMTGDEAEDDLAIIRQSLALR